MQLRNILLVLLFSVFSLQADLILIRHGEGMHNVQGYFSTDPEHPHHFHAELTPFGILQVRTTAHALIQNGITSDLIEKVYVSPLYRTQQTAATLAEQGLFSSAQCIIDHRIREVSAGSYEGKHKSQFPWDTWDYTHAEEYGGETEDMIRERMLSLFAEIKELARKKHVLFITHGGAAMLLIEALTGVREKLPTGGYKIIVV